jgi:hypothetical protein
VFKTGALYQNDPRWKNKRLGNDVITIGKWGCLLTSMTMVANGFGYDETPESLNEKLKGAGGFQKALVIPAALPTVCPKIIYKGYRACVDTPAPIAEIDAALAAGLPVIVQVDWSPKSGVQSHWVVLYGKDAEGYLMRDPYQYSGDSPDKKLYMLDRYKYMGTDPARAITGVVWYAGKLKSEPPSPLRPKPRVPVPADSIEVHTTVDGLALRTDPDISGDLIKRLPDNAKLVALEPKARAEEKVGKVRMWMHIQDEAGDQGYVAAWYVRHPKDPAEPDEGFRPIASVKGLIVVPTADGLAFRTQPEISDATLIRRLPISTTLRVDESETQAKNKIGVVGQWLKVKDIGGTVGYVAAWYVTPSGNPALGPREKNKGIMPDEVDKLILLTTAPGVALRSAPLIQSNTLMKYLLDGAELIPVEDGAEAKIGVHNQWIRVRDIEGDTGYVAAWYVTRRL